MKLHFVDSMDEVLRLALERELPTIPLATVAPPVELTSAHPGEDLMH
jgi:hypothetical protein